MSEFRSVTVRTGARLHLGLLETRAPFRGGGLMIDRPATDITIRAAEVDQVLDPRGRTLPADDPLARRVQAVVVRFRNWCHENLPQLIPAVDTPLNARVVTRPDPHTGLGTGTQLAMAVATGLQQGFGCEIVADVLARQIAGRGARSAVGIQGFLRGGFICDVAHPLRYPVPSTWRFALLRPQGHQDRIWGETETQRFAGSPAKRSPQRTDALRHMLSELTSTVRVGDFQQFAATVSRYNQISGSLFADSQGGPYNGPAITRLIQCLQEQGWEGVGQSSWGPTVFVCCPDQTSAEQLLAAPPAGIAHMEIARPLNAAAQVTWNC